MPFNLRRFLLVFFFSALASFLTLLLVQYLQGEIEEVIRIVGKALVVGASLALMISIPRRRKDYPWM